MSDIPPKIKQLLLSQFPGISVGQVQQLNHYVQLLKSWNERINLVSRKDLPRVWEHHVLPSIAPLHLTEFPQSGWVLDIGSGGGFPAIPVKILRPDLQMLLVESVRKKALFLQHVIQKLKLEQTSVMCERVEKLVGLSDFHSRFDVVTARAVTNLEQLFRWSQPFLRPGGKMVFWKGERDKAELISLTDKEKIKFEILEPPEWLTDFSENSATLRWFVLYPKL